MQLKRPKMIMFDYGQTLGNEPGYDIDAGMSAILQRADYLPEGVTVEDLKLKWIELFGELVHLEPDSDDDNLLELHNASIQRYILEYFGIGHSLGRLELDELFWDNAANAIPTKGIEDFLSFLKDSGIRTAIISNLMYSGEALARRVSRILPKCSFEFMFASSDYLFRKPSPKIFELAVKRSGLKPEEIWYCGDNAVNDCEGSSELGIFPVWYTGAHRRVEQVPKCEHLKIEDWGDLAEVIKSL